MKIDYYRYYSTVDYGSEIYGSNSMIQVHKSLYVELWQLNTSKKPLP